MEYLIRPADNDIGKVRSFYVWIASQTLQNVADFAGDKLPATDTPLYVLVPRVTHLMTQTHRCTHYF